MALFYTIPIWCLCWFCCCTAATAQDNALSVQHQQLLDKGFNLYDNKEYAAASSLFDKLIAAAQKEANQKQLGQLYLELGTFYQKQELYSKSLDLLLQSSVLLASSFSTERSNIIIPELEESPNTYLLEIPKDAAIICEVYNKIGGVYFKQQNYKKAKKYWKKTYQVAEQYKSAKHLASACNNLGELERLDNNLEKALNYYNRALFLQKTTKDSLDMLVSWSNIGSIHLKMGKAALAKQYYDEAYQVAKNSNNTTALLYSYRDYSAYYQQKKQVNQSLQWTKKSLALAQEQGRTDIRLEAHKRLAELYEQQKLWDSLVVHQELWSKLQQENIQQGRKKMTLQIEAEFLVNQQEKEVLRWRQETLLAKEKNYKKDLLQWAISISLLLLLLPALWGLYLTKKHNREVSTQMQHIEQQNAEKEILLKEIHHRVKNNLQVVTSLLHLQSHDIKDPATRALFDQSQYRINAMAMIHEMLYQSSDLSAIDYQTYLKQLINKLVRSIKGSETAVQLELNITPLHLNIDTAIPLGLLINELITNSLKYGLDKGKDSILTVHLTASKEGNYLLEIGDNGKGMQNDWTKTAKPQSLGLRLVKQLALQLEGQLIQQKDKPGTHYQLQFKEVQASI